MPEPIKVISQTPPGGRCTLYALYAAELESCLGLSKRVVHSDCRDAHAGGFPSLLLKDDALKPSDGVILSPEDIYAALVRAGIDLGATPDLLARLEAIQDKFLEGL
jgi:cystathionine gamma-synthase